MPTSKERVRVGTKPLTPYGGSEPVFIEVPLKWEQPDKVFIDDPHSLKDVDRETFEAFHEIDPTIIRVAEYSGWIVSCHDPFTDYKVIRAVDGTEVPKHLEGKFTSMRAIKRAIDSAKD